MKSDTNKFRAVLVLLTLSPIALFMYFFLNFDGNITMSVDENSLLRIEREPVNIPLICITVIIFWVCMIAGYVLLAKINKSRKSKIKNKQTFKKTKPGIICFFSNRFALVFDLMMGISFVLMIIFSIVPVLNCAVIETFAVFLFSLHMHSVFNGVNYKYIKSISDKKEGE